MSPIMPAPKYRPAESAAINRRITVNLICDFDMLRDASW